MTASSRGAVAAGRRGFAPLRACLTFALLAVCALPAMAAEPLKLVVGDMAPYSMASGTVGPGSMVEITQALARRLVPSERSHRGKAERVAHVACRHA